MTNNYKRINNLFFLGIIPFLFFFRQSKAAKKMPSNFILDTCGSCCYACCSHWIFPLFFLATKLFFFGWAVASVIVNASTNLSFYPDIFIFCLVSALLLMARFMVSTIRFIQRIQQMQDARTAALDNKRKYSDHPEIILLDRDDKTEINVELASMRTKCQQFTLQNYVEHILFGLNCGLFLWSCVIEVMLNLHPEIYNYYWINATVMYMFFQFYFVTNIIGAILIAIVVIWYCITGTLAMAIVH